MSPKQRIKKTTNVLILMKDTALSTGILNILSKKRKLLVDRLAPKTQSLTEQYFSEEAGVVIFNANARSSQTLECLITLIANPNVTKILMVHPDKNLVEVLKKQQITITETQDFTRLF